jgi:hypothetical protein
LGDALAVRGADAEDATLLPGPVVEVAVRVRVRFER